MHLSSSGRLGLYLKIQPKQLSFILGTMEDLDLLSKDLINCEPHHRDAEHHSNRRLKLSPKYRTDKN